MAGEIALVGGDEFRTGCEEMDRGIMRASGRLPAKVIVVPTAAISGPDKAAKDGTTHFAALGGESSSLMLLKKEHAEDPDFFAPITKAAVMRRPRSGSWVEALSVVPGVAVLPHHEGREQSEISKDLQETAPSGLVYLGIDARTGCLGKPGNWRVVGFGRVTVYLGKEWQIFSSGDKLPSGF